MGDPRDEPAGAAAAGSGARGVGARLSRGQASCCWCSTTASISSMRSRVWSTRSSIVARRCRCWRRAGRASVWRASGSWRCRRWASRPAMRTATSSGRRRRCVCSGIGPAQRSATSRSPIATSVRWGCCVGASMGSRSRSSSPRRGCGRCHRRISSPGSISGSSSSPTAVARHWNATRRCGARSTGPMTCSPRRNVMRCNGCRCSRVAVTSGPRRRSCPATSSTQPMWSTCWVNWWTSPSSSPTTPTAGCVTASSRPSASTRGSDSTPAATRSRCDAATPTTTSRWPKRPVRTYGAESTSSGPASSPATSTTSAPRSTGPSRHPRPTTRCAWWPPLAVYGRIGELAMDWAATAIAIPGGDGHPLFPVVAAWAAWGATMGHDFERAEDLVAVAERAQAALGTRLASVARASGDPRVLSQ